MENAEIRKIIEEAYGARGLEFGEQRDRLVVRAPREIIHELCLFLRDHAELQFNYLSDMTAYDLLDLGLEPRFEVIYHLYSIGEKYHRIIVKAGVPEDDCQIATVSDVWMCAEFAECEVWDMYGIRFENHPNLYRLIMHEDWEGHPLRKDFPLGGSTSFYYKRDTHEYAGEPQGMVPRIRMQKGEV
ncbi:NADH-quinone oxidoreductase subunit C [Candidatus Sumerlaeota bacterium]|nr:NADH-quinone oxidoreductase subunit C [Candidatus Sumerlaeota bacterium]